MVLLCTACDNWRHLANGQENGVGHIWRKIWRESRVFGR